MASLIYNKALHSLVTGAMDADTDTFKCLLVTSTYSPNKDTHEDRADITNEVANGNGYTTGGNACTVSVNNDTANDRIDITLGAPSNWTTSTITARAAVYYKSTGSAATDLLVAYIDFGTDVSSTNGTFSLTASTMRIQN